MRAHRVWLTTQANRSGILAGAQIVPIGVLRPKHCPKCIKRGQPSGIHAAGCDEVCEIDTWARGRFTSRLLGGPPRRQRATNHKIDIDDLMGNSGDASSEGNDGSGEEPDANEADEVQEDYDGDGDVPATAEGGRFWLPAWRWGWAPETWTKLLDI